jgi:hypothetical protein
VWIIRFKVGFPHSRDARLRVFWSRLLYNYQKDVNMDESFDKILVEGTVTEAFPGAKFNVEL